MSILASVRQREVEKWLAGLGSTAVDVIRKVKAMGINDDAPIVNGRSNSCPIARAAMKKFGTQIRVSPSTLREVDPESTETVFTVSLPAPVAGAVAFYDAAKPGL